MSEIIAQQTIRQLVDGWIAAGKRVIAPKRIKPGLAMYAPLSRSDELVMEGFIRPQNSIKDVLFPRHEVLYAYRFEGKKIVLSEPEPMAIEQIVIGARPCDAASLPILDHVFNWDYKDKFYNRRRELTTIVTLACREFDRYCFCTSVGLGPAAERGSDAMLLELGDGSYEVHSLTDKGRALLAGKTESSGKTAEVPAGPQRKFDVEAVREFLAGNFESPIWQEFTLRCLGCGACSYTCPTCHCFDIVDEGNAAGGVRVKNWDACQFGLFTQHASGHNPRSVQPQRQRQRLYHKFHIYPTKFGEILCTGCGNCTRNCPVGLGVQPVLEEVWRKVPIRSPGQKGVETVSKAS